MLSSRVKAGKAVCSAREMKVTAAWGTIHAITVVEKTAGAREAAYPVRGANEAIARGAFSITAMVAHTDELLASVSFLFLLLLLLFCRS